MRAEDSPRLPVLRVALLGADEGVEEFGKRVGTYGWPAWNWQPPDWPFGWHQDPFTLCTPKNRVVFLKGGGTLPRELLACFDADVLLLASAWCRPTYASGPAKMYGRQVFRRAKAVLWLGAKTRPREEERTLRGALRACGLPGDEATSVWSDLDPRGTELAEALDAVYPGYPDEVRGLVRSDIPGTVFRCGACDAALTLPLRHTRTWPDLAKTPFSYSRRMFPSGGVFAYAPNGEAWGRGQPGPSPGVPEAALLNPGDALPNALRSVPPVGGGCCGSVPVGEMNSACVCGHRVGYLWTECVFFVLQVLRLDRVRVVRTEG